MSRNSDDRDDPKRRMAKVLAVVATFFGAPELYYHTIPYVMAFAQSRYGPELAPLAIIGWALIVALFIYYGARITFDVALFSAVIAVGMRLL